MADSKSPMAITSTRLEVWDYVVMTVVVLLSSCVGIYHVFAARGAKNAREFLVTSHDLGLAPLILSTVATFVSAVGILGFPVETYTNGAIMIPMCICPLIIILPSIYLYLPVFFNLGTSTIFEYLELRFHRFMRISSSLILNIQCVLYTACVIYAPALALNQVTGLHLWASVLSIGTICVLYTSMGGLKAVVWADVVQMLVMASVLAIIVFKGVYDVGGFSEVWRIATEAKRANPILFKSSPTSFYTSWTILVAGTVHFLGPITINQLMMQRYMSNNSLKRVRMSFIGGCIGISMMTFLTTFSGLVAYARYHGCDPLLSGAMTSRDQLLAAFGIETLSFFTGLPGIFMGAILCATLSTLSSALNSLSAVTMEDYIRPLYPNLSDKAAMRLSKILGIMFGTLCVALVAVAESMGGVAKAVFSISGVLTGPVLSLFTIGMLLPWVTTVGAASGFFVSLLFNAWACIGSLVTKPVLPAAPFRTDKCNVTVASDIDLLLDADLETSVQGQLLNGSHTAALFADAGIVPSDVADGGFPLYAVPALWYTLWSLCISTVVSLFVSMIFGMNRPSDIDPNYISPITKNVCMLLPLKIQQKLGYGPSKKKRTDLETRYSELPLKIALKDEEFDKPLQPTDM